ncbi:polar amino acid transport system substrate-binding protein [Devosia enhydra]|uniref:Polar amino acid transport system substrate-binding protein n=1 Tax=Devosia enhydra TaxID=665118 RepID=A0A1K2I1M5_9HYPH|nr:transporter substrate-binding domain-containing protein [Devosia enhydra]SFZ86286.1 polar amino acid transport system substrate-binding protein [Devosia enhydra]
MRAFRTVFGLLFTVLAALLAPAPLLAQNLPYHIDPSARDVQADLSAVPAIRFLTTADYPPFNYRDATGELVGFNIDLARGLCAALEVACTVQAWPWDQAARALEDNQGDVLIAGLGITPETAESFAFSSIYLMFPGRFVMAGTPVSAFDPASFAGRRVGVREGSAHAQFLTRYLPAIAQVPFETEIAALDALKAGAVDAVFADGLRASFWLNANLECCHFAGEAYFRPDLFGPGMAMAVPEGRDAVRVALDAGLIRMKRSGALDELYLRWFPVSFY